MADSKFAAEILAGIPEVLPEPPELPENVSRAPKRPVQLTTEDTRLALRNALRYFPPEWHQTLLPEFKAELDQYGHIYMYRFMPSYPIHSRPLKDIPHSTPECGCIMLMILNNLDPQVAQHPFELVTYGGNGAVFQNWAQYRLVMQKLAVLTREETLVLYSGHPLGVFPAPQHAPRVVVTNGMMVPNHSSVDNYNRLNALGVTNYGQMTAGSFMYIGPQGIVHGTTITLLNAIRIRYRQDSGEGLLFVSSGLGGMSGAQAKAGKIVGAVSIIAEVNELALKKRYEQNWLDEIHHDLPALLSRTKACLASKTAVSLGYHGNIVDLWEALERSELTVHIGSDQSSLHNPYGGGYYPAGLSLEEANKMISQNPEDFKSKVQKSMQRQVKAINALVDRGMYFFDYGNGFLLEASRMKADITRPDGTFKYPSYVQDIMGPICFDYGFGPFRWVCSSNLPKDLATTDAIALQILKDKADTAPESIKGQINDNIRWLEQADQNELVVGSQARILYADAETRVALGLAFNESISEGKITAPVILGRDHHGVSGTDSPYRETSDIYDGSNITADMAVHNVIGDSIRGATWVSLHNGGGVGWGEVINGGFGLVMDGTADAEDAAKQMLTWDVCNGVSRRAWAGNKGAIETIKRAPANIKVTIPHIIDENVLNEFLES